MWGPRFLHTAEVTGSIPVTPTSTNGFQRYLLGTRCQQIASKPLCVRGKRCECWPFRGVWLLEAQVQQGLWWLPSQPDNKLHGVLSCEPNDWVKLSLIGGLGADPSAFQADMVAGLIQGAWVTLLGCTQAGFKVSAPGFESQQLFAQAILRGAAFETPDEVQFDQAIIVASSLSLS